MYSVLAVTQHESTRDFISETGLLGTVDVSEWNEGPDSAAAGWAWKLAGSPAVVIFRPSCGRS